MPDNGGMKVATGNWALACRWCGDRLLSGEETNCAPCQWITEELVTEDEMREAKIECEDCPFCGSDRVDHHAAYMSAKCDQCGCRGPVDVMRDRAVERWNAVATTVRREGKVMADLIEETLNGESR